MNMFALTVIYKLVGATHLLFSTWWMAHSK